MILTNFVTSYLITVLHLVIIGTMIIVKVYFVSSRNEGAGDYSRAQHYQRLVYRTDQSFGPESHFINCKERLKSLGW